MIWSEPDPNGPIPSFDLFSPSDGDIIADGRNEAVWNGRDDSGRQVASGTYFYRLEAGEYSETRRMALIK